MPVTGLSSASTTDQVKAAYDDNASYDVDGSISEAQIFLAACRILLRRIPAAARQGDSLSVEMDVAQIKEQHDRCLRWLNVQSDSGRGVRFTDFGMFRQ